MPLFLAARQTRLEEYLPEQKPIPRVTVTFVVVRTLAGRQLVQSVAGTPVIPTTAWRDIVP